MVRKRKGRNSQKNAKRVKASNKSGQNESQNGRDKTTAKANYNRPHSRKESVELIDVDELDNRSGSQDGHRSTLATKPSGAGGHHAGTRASGWGRTALVEGTRTGKMPHPWFKKWGWWFLPLSLIGGSLGAWWGIRHIEGQVVAAAPEILNAAGVDTAGLTFDADYRNISVAGDLPVGVSVNDVERLLEENTGVNDEDIRHAAVTAREAPAPEPEAAPKPAPVLVEQTGEISVSALSDGQSIRLAGSVPDQEHANRLLASAALAVGEDNVVNELSVLGLAPSAAEPDAQIDRLAQVLPQLGSGISSAELALGDETFSGSIDAIDASAKSELDPIVATVGGNEVSVTAPAIESEINVFASYSGQQIVLSGDVINEAQGKTLIDAAAESVGKNNVVSSFTLLQPNSEAAASDAQIALLGETLRQYGGLRSAESRLNASRLYLRGVAKNDSAKRNVDQSLQSGTVENLSIDGEITLLSMESEVNLLQEELDALADEIRENVVFATNSDVLDLQATEVLSKVVVAIQKYQRPRVKVSGHTDSVGPAGGNQVLSTRRASAVQAFLTSNGVDAERLRATGFGESQPIGENNTAAGRQRNRRVEFTAVGSF